MFSFFKKKQPLVTDLSWLGVDLHSHLLPGLDDGAPDLDTSIYLIKKLNELGLYKFICTPHIFKELYPNTRETINKAHELVLQALNKEKNDITILTAAEHMIDGDFVIHEELAAFPGQYILIEMSYLSEAPQIEQVVFDLQIKGFTVILAHPERYNFYHKNLNRYQRFKEMGCLFQLNLLAVTGYYGAPVKKASDYLLQKGYYDLAATDLHHDKHLHALTKHVTSGQLFEQIGNYPFKNKILFH